MPFDPCREWLGIDAVDLASPHKVLGLGIDEADASSIVQAADARLSTLRAIDPGPFDKAHAAIVARVAEAREELLKSTTGSGGGARRTVPAGLTPPPPPRSTMSPPASPAPSVPPPVPPSPRADLGFVTAGDQDDPRDQRVVLRSAVPKRTSGSGGVFAALSLIVAVAAVVGVYAFWPTLTRRADRKVAIRHSAPAPSTPTPAPHPNSRQDEKRLEPNRKEAPASETRSRPEQQEQQKPREDQAAQEELRRQESRERERLAALQKREQEAAEAREKEAREQEASRLEADERSKAGSAVERALGATYAALKRHDDEAARRSLQAAVKAAGENGDLATRVDRWTLLVDYAAQLEQLQQQAIASANEGRDYTIGNRTIAIIEIGPRTYAYKEAGQTRRGSRASLPRAIERAILAKWFDGDNRAANHIFLGVHHLLDDEPDLTKVRTQWDTALAGEPATKSLMPLLADPILTGVR